ncbi:hypothetical protein CROQUDRAFT_316960 [Cronartium quercuum f. sp. fusiforme G11]|uniref:Beta-xylanase n=1 Tax=Cronartium quercuum f. sp. fusiforme G11 TaxID=708437 RepID=A0A9P6NXJ4_9BASI|nr:hypothetical protein CROQUDRAFT_316960 [Cronartium quercuum f. sp. fusiforme G11]
MRQSTIHSFSILMITGILSCCFTKTEGRRLSSIRRMYTPTNSKPDTVNQNQSSPNGTEGCHKSRLYAGTAVDKPYLYDNQEYIKIVKKDFKFMTPGNVMKWDATEKTQGNFTFADADAVVKFAKDNKKKVRGHTAVWHQQYSKYLEQLDPPALITATQNHIKTVLQHYKNDLYSFDVCNEVVGDDGNLRDSFWFKKLGDSYIEMAFQAAIDAGTKIKLYINDYGVEGPGAKTDTYYKIAQNLASKQILHGVGFQAHLIVGKVPSLEDLKATLKRFVDLGLEVAYTEVDIRIPLPPSQSDFIQQAKDFSTIVRACAETPKCKGVTVWGVGYNDSWVPGFYHNYGDALLFDDNYKPTLAFTSFENALKGNYTQ